MDPLQERLQELAAAAGLTERELWILEWMLEHGSNYQHLALAMGVAPTVANSARTKLRKKITVAAAGAEERSRHQVQDAKDAEQIATGAYGFYAALLECFGNTQNSSPRTPVFTNVRRDGITGTLTGETAKPNIGTAALVTPADLIREARKRE